MSKHTPGPWITAPVDAPRVIRDDRGYCVASVSTYTSRRLPERSADETTANAHLVAAAPEMLEALKELVFRANLADEDNWIEVRAMDAIAKAEGQS